MTWPWMMTQTLLSSARRRTSPRRGQLAQRLADALVGAFGLELALSGQGGEVGEEVALGVGQTGDAAAHGCPSSSG